MNVLKFESGIINISFLLTFLTTNYYWIKTIFFTKKNQFLFFKNLGFILFTLINILLSFELTIRWIESGHFPLSSLYESLIFLSWGVILFYLFIEKFLNTEFIGVIISPLVLCIFAFSEFSLPDTLKESKALVPALQSNWLFMHVSVMIISYAALLLGSILAITYLVIFKIYSNRKSNLNDLTRNSTLSDSTLEKSISQSQSFLNQFKILFLLDNLSYRGIGIGFCFLTLGILSGAVWANETWGSYWSWDPKETWALITWLIFAIYLHTRFLYGWEGPRPAFIASFGFFLLWICYLGVNLLGKGLHTYGFLN